MLFLFSAQKTKHSKVADHLVGTLHMLNTKYPESWIIMGTDKNSMDVTPILNCGLRLKQVVNQPTINGKVPDILIMNLSMYYKGPVIAPPLCPDNPDKAKPSDH